MMEELARSVFEVADGAVDQQHLSDLLADRALVHDMMNASRVAAIREEMERAAAKRLQPFHIQTFFLEAFKHLGGRVRKRETGRWEITGVLGPNGGSEPVPLTMTGR